MNMKKSEDYSNREIDRMFHELKEIMLRVEAQTIKTNGRVTSLERWKEGAMGKVIGAGSVIAFVWGVAWFYITKRL